MHHPVISNQYGNEHTVQQANELRMCCGAEQSKTVSYSLEPEYPTTNHDHNYNYKCFQHRTSKQYTLLFLNKLPTQASIENNVSKRAFYSLITGLF